MMADRRPYGEFVMVFIFMTLHLGHVNGELRFVLHESLTEHD